MNAAKHYGAMTQQEMAAAQKDIAQAKAIIRWLRECRRMWDKGGPRERFWPTGI